MKTSLGMSFAGIVALGFAALAADEPAAKILLWSSGAPGAVGETPADKPMLSVYLPPKKDKPIPAVVVCPGGGYGGLAMSHEGLDIARWLNERGVAAYILQYRLGPRYRHPAPLQDAQRAIRMVRTRAAEDGIDPKRVGVWGFSAGGHLASTVSTHFDEGQPSADNPVDQQSCRPDFAILCYPVISFNSPFTHAGSRKNLLGDKPDAALVANLSNETQVTAKTPPTFLFHTTADAPVPPENSIVYYLALRKAGVPAELHIYEKGPHGVGLAQRDPVLSTWPARLEDWLRGRGFAP